MADDSNIGLTSFQGVGSTIGTEPANPAPSQVNGVWWEPDGDAYYAIRGFEVSKILNLADLEGSLIIGNHLIVPTSTPNNDDYQIFDTGTVASTGGAGFGGFGMFVNQGAETFRLVWKRPEPTALVGLYDIPFRDSIGRAYPHPSTDGAKIGDEFSCHLVINRFSAIDFWADLYIDGTCWGSTQLNVLDAVSNFAPAGIQWWATCRDPADAVAPTLEMNGGTDTGYMTKSHLILRIPYDKRDRIPKIIADHQISPTVNPVLAENLSRYPR